MKLASKAARSGRPRSFDEGLALEKAMIVFWQKGYDDASITDLGKAMGITPPSLYAAFGNKQPLFLRALQHYAEGPSSYALKALEALTARQVAEQRLYATIEARCDSAWPPGCLATQTAARWGAGKSAIGQAILASGDRLHKAYVERFERAKAEGDLPPGRRSGSLSALPRRRRSRSFHPGDLWCHSRGTAKRRRYRSSAMACVVIPV
jgi:AcrR family transcriptional regulator